MASSLCSSSLFLAGRDVESCSCLDLLPPSSLCLNKSCLDLSPQPPVTTSQRLIRQRLFKASFQVSWWQTQATLLIQFWQAPSSTSIRGPHCGFQHLPDWKRKTGDASPSPWRRQPEVGANPSSLMRGRIQELWRDGEAFPPPDLEEFFKKVVFCCMWWPPAGIPLRFGRWSAAFDGSERVATRSREIDACPLYVSHRGQVVILFFSWVPEVISGCKFAFRDRKSVV